MKERTHKSTFLALGFVLIALMALLLIPTVATARDGDGDGYDSKVNDCNDKDASINPGAIEICDNIDNNCDGQVDENDVCGVGQDDDGDGYTVVGGDCEDHNAAINPGVVEEGVLCDNGIDDNCDGITDAGGDCSSGDDSDGDGFSDDTESAGIVLPTDFILAGTRTPDNDGERTLQKCADPANKESPCVHPDRPDLFVVINRASPSNIPSPPYADSMQDPLAILRGFTDANGNPVVPHELELVDPNTPLASREITDGQNAVIVNELLDADFGALGFAPTGGTPNTTSGKVSLYTERIKYEVERLCDEAVICDKNGCYSYPVGVCRNEDGTVIGIPGLQTLYIQNVLAHETWHVCALAPSDSAEVILYHFNPNTGWVMEQSIGAKGSKAKNDVDATVTLYISETFNTESRAKYKLK